MSNYRILQDSNRRTHYYHQHHHYHPLYLLHSSSAVSQNSTGVTEQTFVIHCSAKNFLTIRRVLRITAFCTRTYRARRRVSSFKLSCYLFGIKSVVICTGGFIQTAFSRHIIIIINDLILRVLLILYWGFDLILRALWPYTESTWLYCD
jgi:hypothetical protein